MCVGVLDSHMQMRLESESTGQTASLLWTRALSGTQHSTTQRAKRLRQSLLPASSGSRPYFLHDYSEQGLALLCPRAQQALCLAVPSSYLCALSWTCNEAILVPPRLGWLEMSLLLPTWNLQGTEGLAHQETLWKKLELHSVISLG